MNAVETVEAILSSCKIMKKSDDAIDASRHKGIRGAVTVTCRGSAKNAIKSLAAYYSVLPGQVHEFWDGTTEIVVDADDRKCLSVYPKGRFFDLTFYQS